MDVTVFSELLWVFEILSYKKKLNEMYIIQY